MGSGPLVTALAKEATKYQSNLCMAGGVALNATTNGSLERDLNVRPFVQPASSDAGLSLGAAYATFHARHGRIPRSQPRLRDCLGRSYLLDEVDDAVANQPLVRRSHDYDDVEALAEVLASGAVVGWFEGGSEFGPRSLGHRSILADPRDLAMRDRINLQIKGREWFRPFGPVVLAEEAHRWFTDGGHSHTMTSTTFVRAELQHMVPAITHVDGSSRIQLLDKSDSAYRLLLEYFYNKTGVPMLINTSFNAKDRPIVESPADAISAFLQLGLDILWIDGIGIVKR
ncbi:carbamoyltransferase C-terminal domain-containing protein [Mycolicibacterium vanbaalenii]|uniref:carbamoyltransferase C-terminal domain-containing protein n=1 Tax=Mycolicibacterium vanbaalenii TaxID=110539 RepID=UPI0023AED25B|nr:carbamoyltransferase C-terminal domain-containing protein [Mycolicibacterium vanbaalenii]